MDLNLSPAEQSFRDELAAWLDAHLRDEGRANRLRDLPEAEALEARRAWSRELGEGG